LPVAYPAPCGACHQGIFSDGYGGHRTFPPSVRADGHVSLPVRTAHAWPVLHAGHHGEHLCDHQAADLAVITRFWGKLFGINFVLGVATGLTMEFEFGTNWAYYAHYVGDIFGAPLAIEG
jgi:hypothetical protein